LYGRQRPNQSSLADVALPATGPESDAYPYKYLTTVPTETYYTVQPLADGLVEVLASMEQSAEIDTVFDYKLNHKYWNTYLTEFVENIEN